MNTPKKCYRRYNPVVVAKWRIILQTAERHVSRVEIAERKPAHPKKNPYYVPKKVVHPREVKRTYIAEGTNCVSLKTKLWP
jgi:hypothetical protein